MTVKSIIRTIQDFPKPGIRFRDLTPLLAHPPAFRTVVQDLSSRYAGRVDKVAAIEARGFIFGSAVAHALAAGFVPVRKPGKLPGESIGFDYALEYGINRIEVHTDAVRQGERVLVVDDLLATGGTAGAAVSLLEQLDASIVGCAFVVELLDLPGRERLEARGYSVHAICGFTEDEA